MSGNISSEKRAELERLLIAFWSDKLKLGQLPINEALAKIKDDAEAGELMLKVEEWLHSPRTSDKVSLDALLKPYQRLNEF